MLLGLNGYACDLCGERIEGDHARVPYDNGHQTSIERYHIDCASRLLYAVRKSTAWSRAFLSVREEVGGPAVGLPAVPLAKDSKKSVGWSGDGVPAANQIPINKPKSPRYPTKS